MMQPTPASESELDLLISEPPPHVIQVVRRHPGRFGVLGAGGKMGFHLSLMLQRAIADSGIDASVTAVSRFSDRSGRPKFDDAGIETLSADLCDANQLAALPDFDAVFYLAGVKFGTDGRPELLNRMNAVMPRLVADRFSRSRIVALSSGCVYSFVTPESGGSTETDTLRPPGAYAKSCMDRERAFQQASQQFGTPVTLVRLNYSIDLRYGVLLDIAQWVMNGRPVAVDTGWVNVIWQGDAVAHVIGCLDHCTSPPFVINVTGPEILSVRELAEEFGRLLNRDVRYSGCEQSTAWLSNAAMSHQCFGVPRVSVPQMIHWTAEWLQRGGPLLDKPTQFHIRDGRY